ncbi:MAG: hypothetical protein KAR40_15945 [Candidatus Sabulitectum sp.]|nr:hypothetical protein [Candidatus Sabulitectum sp.]
MKAIFVYYRDNHGIKYIQDFRYPSGKRCCSGGFAIADIDRDDNIEIVFGTSSHVSYFDDLKDDDGYAGRNAGAFFKDL